MQPNKAKFMTLCCRQYGHHFAPFFEHISMVCDGNMYHMKMPNNAKFVTSYVVYNMGIILHHCLSMFQWWGVWQEYAANQSQICDTVL
jgi:hypothetical protein